MHELRNQAPIKKSYKLQIHLHSADHSSMHLTLGTSLSLVSVTSDLKLSACFSALLNSDSLLNAGTGQGACTCDDITMYK